MEEKCLLILTDKITKNSYKLTGPRLAILDYLAHEKGHHDIMDIYEKIRLKNESIGMATIYRTIDLFLELGIVRVLTLKNSQPCFEINWPDDHHHHLVCTECGHIIEFGSCNFKLIVGEIEKVTCFRVEEHTLEAYGLCPKCAQSRDVYSTEKM
ncbi:MAG: Fur family transcriptional regulator [Bacillota bacterium]|nr:transcriptional repressor [Bacillota bacterium]MDW7728916.1 Fur family transcriptional regulator [Bacillota bacterium]